ncbi:germination protein YpeB [Oceanobacillus senegalensis]|uniref:germination protein YpeB n=1 Tax=Oceanobacillus senegalensis TaxID=1936063 RepID=UPI000A31168F|nr:germination protein YpeB [Oceanobacillus senegalensis]
MVRWIIIAALSLGIAGTAFWGYQEHQEKNAILIQAENTYQGAFHELAYHMDLLHDEIGTALAMNSDKSLSPQMVEIWRLTSEASSNVGQLPLGLLPFNKTEEFLSQIGDFTYRTAVRNLDDEPLSKEETETLQNLYEQSAEIEHELRKVQHLALENNLRWMDVQLALADEDQQVDNTIIDGLKTVEKSVEGFSESNVDSPIIGTSSKEHKYLFLSDKKEISESEARKISQKLFNLEDGSNIKITESGDGADLPMYSASYTDGDFHAYMDLSKQGGHPISLLVNRPIGEKQISLNEGMEKAKQYIEKLGYEDMVLFQSSEYGKTGAYSFLHSEDGVRVYSDALEVKVALDNGEILGITARNYLMNHKERDIPEPKLSASEAKEVVNSKVDIKEEFLSIIDNDLGEEVLTYEFLGVYGDDTYRIFINAMDGKEEKIDKLGGSEVNYAIN